MIYAYIRVSTDKQDTDNQRLELERWAERDGFTIDKWVEEEVSGTKDWKDRKLKKILNNASKGDRIVCSEISRLARKFFMLMEILSICQKRCVEVWTRKGDYRLGDNIQSQVLAFAFGISAQIERDLISARTKDALARKKAEGVILGRPKNSFLISDVQKERIIEFVKQGKSHRAIAKEMNVSPSTVYTAMRRWGCVPRELGRPQQSYILGEPEKEKIIKLYKDGLSKYKIAKIMNVAPMTIWRACKRWGLDG